MTVKAFVMYNGSGQGDLVDVEPNMVEGLQLVEPPPWHPLYGEWLAFVKPVPAEDLPEGVDTNWVAGVFAGGMGWTGYDEDEELHGDVYFFGPPEDGEPVSDVPPPLVLSSVMFYAALLEHMLQHEEESVS